jgi:hypothetical protein
VIQRTSATPVSMVVSIAIIVVGVLSGCGTGEPPAPLHATSSAQAAQLAAACMTEHGWPATASGDSWTAGSIPEDQLAAYDADATECVKGLVPDVGTFTDAEWEKLYAKVTKTVECLAGLGKVVSNAPSLQAYRDGHASWSVYQELIDTGIIKPGEVDVLAQKCPQPDYWPGG